jgi:hypothetical protein
MAREKLYRANWMLLGHRGKTVLPGETIRLTAEDAAPYVQGGVLSAVDDEASQEAERQAKQ